MTEMPQQQGDGWDKNAIGLIYTASFKGAYYCQYSKIQALLVKQMVEVHENKSHFKRE